MNQKKQSLKKDFQLVSINIKNIFLHSLITTDKEVQDDVKEIIKLFNKENIDLEQWGLFDIPISGNYFFVNWNTEDQVAFANYYASDDSFVPIYIDNQNNEQVAETVHDAIKLERID